MGKIIVSQWVKIKSLYIANNFDYSLNVFFSPSQHGPELVKLLSQILNQCGGVEGGLPSSLALQGITALCKAEIVNVATTWRALAPKLSRDKRPAVITR